MLWRAAPHPWTSARGESGAAAFAVLWIFMSALIFGADARSGKIMPVVMGLVFEAVGLFILARPLVAYRAARHTSYTITDRRFIISKKRHRSLTSIRLASIAQVERLCRHGRVTLRIPASLVSDGDGGQKVDYVELHGIEDAARAYQLLTRGDV